MNGSLPSNEWHVHVQDIMQPQRRQPPRRKAHQQPSMESDSSDEDSPLEQEESFEEEDPPSETQSIRRQRSARVHRRSVLSETPSDPTPAPSQSPDVGPDPSSGLFQSEGWGASGTGLTRRPRDTAEDIGPAAGAEGLVPELGLSPLGPVQLPGSALHDALVFPMSGSLDQRHRLAHIPSPFEGGLPSGRARAVQGGPAAAVSSLDLPFDLPYSSGGSSALRR